MISLTFDHFKKHTCLKFIEGQTDDGNFIWITNNSSDSCWAVAGYDRKPAQRLNLAAYCMNQGGVRHELMHAIGFFHQHVVPERDNFISINEDAILPKNKNDFVKLNSSLVTNLGYDYDFNSITHYHAYEGGNGSVVITPLDEKKAFFMGQGWRLTRTDVGKINTLYGCPDSYYQRRDLATNGS